MFNVGGGEVIVILIAALIVLGPDKLPNAARQVGKYLAEFRKISSGFQDELRSAMDVSTMTEPVAYPPAEPETHTPDMHTPETQAPEAADAEPPATPTPAEPDLGSSGPTAA
jgi:Tat protein translocase TatB subunit